MGTAVATQPAAAKPPATLDGLLRGEGFKKAVEAALPSHIKPDRFIRIALTAMTRTPKLKECDQGSFFQCLLTLSQLGLEPDGRRAHLIPFNNNKRGVVECQLIIDYKGLVELVMRTGKVSFIHADVVCQNDEFEYDRGELKKHKIDLRKPRGEVYASYSFVRFKDHSEKCEVMSREEIEAIRQRSRAKNAGPWVTDWNEMAKKTVFRRLSKWVELSPELRDAVEADDDQFELKPSDLVGRAIPAAMTLDELAQLPEIEAEDESQDIEQNEVTQDEKPEATEPTPTKNGNGSKSKKEPEKYGEASHAWPKFKEQLERVSNDSALMIKESLGWLNTPFNKLSTAQLLMMTTEMAKVNVESEPAAG